MPIEIRPIAIRIAVLAFFVVAAIGWFRGFDPFVCCKKAVLGAVMAYVGAVLALKGVNAIILHSIISNQLRKRNTVSDDQ